MWQYLWTLPMNLAAWLLVRLAKCSQDVCGDWIPPVGGWLDRLMHKYDKTAFTPAQAYIVFRSDTERTVELYRHEFVHAEQHCKYGPFFLPAYFWYSLVSRVRGTGWYWGNKLEIEARRKG